MLKVAELIVHSVQYEDVTVSGDPPKPRVQVTAHFQVGRSPQLREGATGTVTFLAWDLPDAPNREVKQWIRAILHAATAPIPPAA